MNSRFDAALRSSTQNEATQVSHNMNEGASSAMGGALFLFCGNAILRLLAAWWRRLAGYIQGDDSIYDHPVILHKDYDRTNFASDNLEWVDRSNPEYNKYLIQKEKDKHNRNVEMNPGKPLPSSL